jgi:hypothetical protein
MTKKRVREVVWEPPSPHQLMEKVSKGWTLVALEWERDMDPEEAKSVELNRNVPYGLRVAADGLNLEENLQEREALEAMLSLIIRDDIPFSQVALTLNQKGYRTREGFKWTQTAVFEMLPRLVEVAPTIFSGDEWRVLKQRF